MNQGVLNQNSVQQNSGLLNQIIGTVIKKNNFFLTAGAIIIICNFLVAMLTPILPLPSPKDYDFEKRYEKPSLSAPFGRDENGADVMTLVFWGSRVSLTVALCVVSITTIVGLLIGSIAGYFGGRVDFFIMRFLDMIYAFPGFLLALAMVAALGPSVRNLILAMSITGWAGVARLVRGEILHLKEKEYVQSAISVGNSSARIISVHIWPNLIGVMTVQCTFAMAGTLIIESGLSFLGLGAPPTTPTWGMLLNSGRYYLVEAPHISIFPGLAILFLVLGFNLLGDGLREILDPKSRTLK